MDSDDHSKDNTSTSKGKRDPITLSFFGIKAVGSRSEDEGGRGQTISNKNENEPTEKIIGNHGHPPPPPPLPPQEDLLGSGNQRASPSILDLVALPMALPTDTTISAIPTGPGAFHVSAIGRILTGYQYDPGHEEELELTDPEQSNQVHALDSTGVSAQAWPISDPVVRATPYQDSTVFGTGAHYSLNGKSIANVSCKLFLFGAVAFVLSVIASSVAIPALCFRDPDKTKQLKIRSAILDAFGTEYFDNPQKKRALHWIVHEDPRNSLGAKEEGHRDNLIQRFSLAAFYFQTSSQQPWAYCNPPTGKESDTCHFKEYWYRTRPNSIGTRWLTASHECHWMGVFCNREQGYVTELRMESNNLTGTVPVDELSMLIKLDKLDLGYNNLTGSIPTRIFAGSRIHTINLRRNKLTGTIPCQVFSLPGIKEIYLNENQLIGSIPTEIGFFRGTNIGLSDNLLTGPIPDQTYRARNLIVLALSNNQLTGTLSSSVGLLTALGLLPLSDNLIQGPIPSQIGLLQLASLALERTSMEGTIPEVLYQNKGLQELLLTGSQFSGTISTRIGQLKGLSRFQAERNKLHGSIPRELSSTATRMRNLYLHGNPDLAGSIPGGFCSHMLPDCKVIADCTPNAATGVPLVRCPSHCCSMCCDSETGICLLQ